MGCIEQEGTPEQVLEHPATPFVMSFLGTVNIFHGRVEAGRGIFGPLAVDYAHADPAPRPAAAYTRPHEFDVSRSDTGGGMWTILEESTLAGAMVKLELAVPDGPAIRAELGRDQFERLGLQPGIASTSCRARCGCSSTERSVAAFITARGAPPLALARRRRCATLPSGASLGPQALFYSHNSGLSISPTLVRL